MRVTNQMMANSLLANMNRLRSQTQKLTDQISSGKRITLSSEDPTAGAAVMRTQSRLQLHEQWETNQNDARQWVRETESALERLTGLLARAKEMAIAGANTPNSEASPYGLAPEARVMLEDMLAILNSTGPEGYLFGGHGTWDPVAGAYVNQPPFSMDDTTDPPTFIYNGTNGEHVRPVGPGISVTVNLHGHRLGLGGTWDPADNMLTTLNQLVQDLASGDPIAVRDNSLEAIDRWHDHVVALRAEVGTREIRLEHMETALKDLYLQLNNTLVQAQGVDSAKAIMELSSAETTYRAALQVGARVFPPTLADFLR